LFDVGEQLRINGPLVAMILAAFVAEAFAVSRADSSGLDRARVEAAVPWVLAAAVVAGRLVFVAREPAVYLERPVDLLIIRSGIDFYGALAGAALVVAWRFPGVRWPALALLALAMLAAVTAQRAGCVLGNHCHGAATDGRSACRSRASTAVAIRRSHSRRRWRGCCCGRWCARRRGSGRCGSRGSRCSAMG